MSPSTPRPDTSSSTAPAPPPGAAAAPPPTVPTPPAASAVVTAASATPSAAPPLPDTTPRAAGPQDAREDVDPMSFARRVATVRLGELERIRAQARFG